MNDENRECSAERLKPTLQYEETKIGENMELTDERYAWSKQHGLFVLLWLTITKDELSQAVSGSEEAVSGTNLALDSVDVFRKSMMQSLLATMHEIAEEGEANESDGEMQLALYEISI